MKGNIKIFRNEFIEIWDIESVNFSIFKRNNKQILNFWIDCNKLSEDSQENRSDSGFTLEILIELPENIDKTDFNLRIPFLEVPSLGNIEKVKDYHNKWGEDKDLYYNVYYEQHIDIINCNFNAIKIGQEYHIKLTGIIDDTFHQGSMNTNISINVTTELNDIHKGFWTE